MSVSDRVLIVGAGPVGTVLALALRRADIPVLLVEALPRPEHDCRAASCHPPTIAMLEQLDLLQDGIEQGLVSPVFHYHDRVTGSVVGRFDLRAMKDPPQHPYVLQWEQYKIADTILERLSDDPGFEARMNTRLVEYRQDDQGVTATVTTASGETEDLSCAYLVGCDGGRSTVRKQTGVEFEGFTWPERFLKIDTRFDFQSLGQDIANRNYFSDPDEWMNLFKARGEDGSGMWRAVGPTDPDASDDDILDPEAIQTRLQKFCPRDEAYEIVTVALYKVHQRVAASFDHGRVLLAGDAAHVNNPVGGMGMNGGIHDAMNLAAKLAKIWHEGADAAALFARYTRQRRKAQIDGVQAQSIANKNTLSERDPEVRAAKLAEIRHASETPDLHDAFIRRACMIDSYTASEAVE
ncbi:FAD-binding protein [Pacificimonas flava]|uniref:FAD-binding protein n=2 Tax=Pacificimonas TaxID=1960290 RepID=A0A219B4Q1_9SPHN|nr:MULTISPECIES: NAD(P)/FAD-dependent oxidoreductase [Pacificimonas]MBZ6377154.1 FAD-dependent monooxygenase [Pacificimonas aurantium]OWV33123.1 FAD-binding protein [Pacificimonas flava]